MLLHVFLPVLALCVPLWFWYRWGWSRMSPRLGLDVGMQVEDFVRSLCGRDGARYRVVFEPGRESRCDHALREVALGMHPSRSNLWSAYEAAHEVGHELLDLAPARRPWLSKGVCLALGVVVAAVGRGLSPFILLGLALVPGGVLAVLDLVSETRASRYAVARVCEAVIRAGLKRRLAWRFAADAVVVVVSDLLTAVGVAWAVVVLALGGRV